MYEFIPENLVYINLTFFFFSGSHKKPSKYICEILPTFTKYNIYNIESRIIQNIFNAYVSFLQKTCYMLK